MKRNERVKGLLGPGGLRCGCCGGQAGRRRASHRRMVRSAVRQARKNDKARDIREWRED